jgi:hypothetical protein
MDVKILEFATQLTVRAMGTDGGSATATWIGSPDKIQEFLKATAKTLNELYEESNERTDKY